MQLHFDLRTRVTRKNESACARVCCSFQNPLVLRCTREGKVFSHDSDVRNIESR